jgi:hypothetical protein
MEMEKIDAINKIKKELLKYYDEYNAVINASEKDLSLIAKDILTSLMDDGMAKLEEIEKLPVISKGMNTIKELVNKIRKHDTCCLKINLDIPGNIWSVEIRGNNYNCEQLVFIEKDGLSLEESLQLALDKLEKKK